MKYIILICLLLGKFTSYSQGEDVEIIREYDAEKQEYKIYVDNNTYSSQIVTFTFKDENNIKCQDGRKQIIRTINRGNRILFTKVSALDPTRSFNFGYTFTYLKGNHKPKPDFDHPYLIPVKAGATTSIKTMTNLNNKYGKDEIPKDWYSITFSTNQGDTIYASRGGIVSLVAEKREENKTEGLLFDRNTNYLVIEHRDGTFADYKLFENDGIIVEPGDQVIPGQALGIITGENYANGSHLRFNVRYYFPIKEETQTSPWAYVKTKFLTEDGVQEIEVNTPYKSVRSEDVTTHEMTRREKKKYLKSKN